MEDTLTQGISCGKGQCREVLLRDTQDSGQAEVFKCVGCGRTAAARNVDGTGPLDIERQADDLYSHAVELLRQQVCCIHCIQFEHHRCAADTKCNEAIQYLVEVISGCIPKS